MNPARPIQNANLMVEQSALRLSSAAVLTAGIFLIFLLFSPGLARADMKTGISPLETGYFSEAYANLLPAAEAGNTAAQFEIGSILDARMGTEIDAHAAAK